MLIINMLNIRGMRMLRRFSEAFDRSSSSYYVRTMYESWRQDPSSVHVSWRAFFDRGEVPSAITSTIPESPAVPASSSELTSKVVILHRAYQSFGYMLADLDPLQLHINTDKHLVDLRLPGYIHLENYKVSDQEMMKEVDIGTDLMTGFRDINGPRRGKWTLGELLDACREAYCGKIGYDFLHIPFRDECNWVRSRAERLPQFKYTTEEKRELFVRMAKGHMLEEFFHKKFSTHKRFGMDGLEAVVLSVEAIIERAVDHGYNTFVIGMPHRGRLSVMVHNLNNDLEDIFRMFFGIGHRFVEEGDVKYHLGVDTVREIKGKQVRVALLANPSHLEAVDPVAMGKTRALQDHDPNTKALTILLHGDAALAGQGVVYETLQMDELAGYGTGGVVHVVMNNNIGFTTTPREARSGLFPTEIAKTIGAPIFHVNADHLQEVDFISKMCSDWIAEFKKTVFVDIIGYRRYGHNELDEPLFTNPMMYQLIQKKTPAFTLFTEQLIADGTLTPEEVSETKAKINKKYETAFSAAKRHADATAHEAAKNFLQWRSSRELKADPSETSVSVERLLEINSKINALDSNLHPHPNISKIYKNRLKAVEKGTQLDWGTGEALAWATILANEKMDVRLSGQDVQRGTFSHRHSVVHDQVAEGTKYVPLNHIQENQGRFSVINSHLSEFGVLGFEYGYTLAHPNTLVIWEAQFGDFANGAQVIIDQFITSGEAKWGQESGLVLLLPHGYDGQGAEHSCARLGRFLQLTSEEYHFEDFSSIEADKQCYCINFQVAVPTTPANYFHMLRRQVTRDFRKPLVIISPKRLLRHREAVSDLEDFSKGTVVTMYDDQDNLDPDSVKKLIICTGQVYFDLAEERRRIGAKDIAITRMEQLAPFPFGKVIEMCNKYKNAKIQWVQEEPMNLGAWHYVVGRINAVLTSMNKDRVSVVARPTSAAAATGYVSVHNEELRDLLEKAMAINE